MMKHIVLLIIFLFATASIVRAQTITQSPSNRSATLETRRQEAADRQAARLTDRLESLRTRGIREIDRRIESLERLIARVGTIRRLSDTQKSSFTTDIQAEIDSLSALKTTVEGATDAEALRTDVKSIRDSYRIYAVFMPKMRIFVATDVLSLLHAKLSELSVKLEARIAEAGTQGNDTSALESELSEMKTNLTNAQTKYLEAEQLVLPLEPEGFPDNRTTLTEAKNLIQEARADLRLARNNAQTIIQGLRIFNATPSASTATPSANL